jgi:hypothetical protein
VLKLLKPGGRWPATLFSGFTPHVSTPNLSDRPRRTIILTYNPANDRDVYEER